MKRTIFLTIVTIVLAAFFLVTDGFADDSGGEIVYKSVTFSHKSHVDGMGFDCETCHDGIFEMEAGSMVASPDFSMDSIYNGEFCGACHDGSMAFASDDDCTTCHTRPGGDILYFKPVKSVLFSHAVHTEAFGCESCHTGMFKMEALAAQENDDFTMESLYQGEYCGACHDGSTAFASDTQCATCHLGVKGYNRMQGGEQANQSGH
ncbi:MAG: hypothetical protein C0622_01825 [Desulfuromonas sp.]|nr:MAG: hypothetical protein C0622_01825 [Desulfuromonas sp.]